MNFAAIAGRITREPRIETGPNGGTLLKLTIETTDSHYVNSIVQTKKVKHKVVAFGRTAREAYDNGLSIDQLICVEGYLHNITWDEDGIPRYRTEIVARKISLL
jgi:single-strand DNA-binding protein